MDKKRYPHFMRQTTGGKWPAHVVCLDCVRRAHRITDTPAAEIYGLVSWHAIILAGGEDGYSVKAAASGTESSAFWEQLERKTSKRGDTWILSYCADDQFAMLAGWEALEDGRLLIEGANHHAPGPDRGINELRLSASLIIESPPVLIRFSFAEGRAKLVWLDTLNYGASPDRNSDQGRHTAQWVSDWFVEYASLCREYKLGSLRPTVGAQAMHGFKCSYYDGGIFNHVHKEASRIEIAGYFGGRSEPYRIGLSESPVWHLDYRSLYPYICTYQGIPARLRSVVYAPGLSEIGSNRGSNGIIATVRIATDEPAYPVRRREEVIYPVGRFTTTLCGPELYDALDRNRVHSIEKAALYDSEPALANYAQAIYALRCAAENSRVSGIAGTAKLLCVCLPGKFGQRSFHWQSTPRFHDYRYYGQWDEIDATGQRTKWRSVAGIVQTDIDCGLAADSNLAIAAYITSAGRMELLKAIRIAGWRHVLYCDTDSVMVDRMGYDALCAVGMVKAGELGKLQVKAAGATCDIRGIKYYVENGKVVCAGLPAGRAEDTGDGRHYWYRASPVLGVMRGQRPTATAQRREYERDIECRHRTVMRDGSTAPIRLEEW